MADKNAYVPTTLDPRKPKVQAPSYQPSVTGAMTGQPGAIDAGVPSSTSNFAISQGPFAGGVQQAPPGGFGPADQPGAPQPLQTPQMPGGPGSVPGTNILPEFSVGGTGAGSVGSSSFGNNLQQPGGTGAGDAYGATPLGVGGSQQDYQNFGAADYGAGDQLGAGPLSGNQAMQEQGWRDPLQGVEEYLAGKQSQRPSGPMVPGQAPGGIMEDSGATMVDPNLPSTAEGHAAREQRSQAGEALEQREQGLAGQGGDGSMTTIPGDPGGSVAPPGGEQGSYNDYIQQYLQNAFNPQSFDPIQQAMTEQRDQNLRQMAEMMAARGMNNSGVAGGMAGDIYRGAAQDMSRAQMDHMQQQIQNQGQAANQLWQQERFGGGQDFQREMAEDMWNRRQRELWGSDWNPDTSRMGTQEMGLLGTFAGQMEPGGDMAYDLDKYLGTFMNQSQSGDQPQALSPSDENFQREFAKWSQNLGGLARDPRDVLVVMKGRGIPIPENWEDLI